MRKVILNSNKVDLNLKNTVKSTHLQNSKLLLSLKLSQSAK